MSTKFEQLLDYLVNEEMDKANELFHEIVVEKSRTIYENLIAEEDEEMDEAADEDMDESADEEEMGESADEDMDESADEDMDESEEELEDSYMMDADETDDFGGDVSADGDNFDSPEDGEHGPEGQEDKAIFDIKNAIAELEAAFAELEQAQGGEEDGMGMDDEFGDEEDEMGDEMGDEDESMGFMEGRRLTREYVEKVGNDWEKNSMKTQGQYLGAGTGEKDGAPVEGRSPISSGKGKPTTGATAANIAKGATGEGNNTGTSPNKVNKGITPEKSEKFASINGNVPGGKMGVKNLSKVAGGHGAEKKGSGPGPVGAGTGDKAGQTSIDPATKRQFLPQSR
jgi:hypothetical protein